jgi:hypothetical protein
MNNKTNQEVIGWNPISTATNHIDKAIAELERQANLQGTKFWADFFYDKINELRAIQNMLESVNK